jgi:hypothetical protein
MNHIYRNVWNEVTRTYVAAAEIVRGRGKRSKSSAGAEGAEAALAASSLLTDGGTQAQAPPKRRKLTLSLPRPMALEQRFMFDGAAMVDAVHTLQPLDLASGTQGTAMDAGRDTGSQASSRLFALADVATAPAALTQARSDAEQLIRSFLASPGARAQMAQIFDGGRGTAAPDARWHAAFDALVAAVERGDSPVQVQLLSSADMQGALGAFAERGLDSGRVIFLNADWLAGGASAKAIELVLAEEFGHAIDNLLSAGADSTGDEGQAFAGLVAYGDANLAATRMLQDAGTVQVSGTALTVETAAPYAIAQTHYVPMAEPDIQTSLKAISTATTGNIQTVIAITATSNGTVVVYDQWEDGYEADITNPAQASTKIWTYNGNQWFVDTNGDGQNNGEPTVSGTGVSVSGNSIILSNAVNPASPSTVDFDGRDKIGSTKAVSVTRAGWSITPGTVLAGAASIALGVAVAEPLHGFIERVGHQKKFPMVKSVNSTHALPMSLRVTGRTLKKLLKLLTATGAQSVTWLIAMPMDTSG